MSIIKLSIIRSIIKLLIFAHIVRADTIEEHFVISKFN